MQNIPNWIKIKKCKKVITRDVQGRENGFLIDILNRYDDVYKGRETELFQQVYYTSVLRGMFKGFHIHPTKYDSVTCVFGKALLVIYPEQIPKNQLELVVSTDELIVIPIDTEDNTLTVCFLSKYPHGFYGISENAHILNYRNPAWHPGDNLQYDYKMKGIEDYLKNWVIKNAYS